MTKKPVIQVHIEELVLHGLPASASSIFAAQLQEELGKLFTEQPPEGPSCALQALDAGVVRLSAGEDASRLSARVAQTIHRRLVR